MVSLIVFLSFKIFAAPIPTKPVDVLLQRKVRDLISSEGDIPVVGLQSLANSKKDILKSIAFDENEEMRMRWRALMALAKTEKEKSKEDLSKAFKSNTWFMRNGALLASPYAGKKWSLKWAKYLFEKDNALLVRMAAVDLIAENKSQDTAKLLWSRLDSKENFHNGQSLMVRGRIMKALSSWSFPNDKQNFKKYINDKDHIVKEQAALALSKLSK